MGRLSKRQRESTGVLRIEPPAALLENPTAVVDRRGASPDGWSAALAEETSRNDQRAARALQMRVADIMVDERRKAEAAVTETRDARRRERRLRRAQARKVSRTTAGGVTGIARTMGVSGDTETPVQDGTETTDGDSTGSRAASDTGPVHTAKMPEPSPEFAEALAWSVKAREALQQVLVRQEVLMKGFAQLALAEAARLEELAAGNHVEDNATYTRVAQQLVAAAAGLRSIAADDWEKTDATPLRVTRARRRFEKRVQKARAKQRRAQIWRDATTLCPAGTFMHLDDRHQNGVQRAQRLTREEAEAANLTLPYAEHALEGVNHRRQPRRRYVYHSGGVYEQPAVRAVDGVERQVRAGQLRATRAAALDLLPTTSVEIRGEKKGIKIDTGAQYCVAGKSWRALGEKLQEPAPVDYMEGFSGVAVRVLGVWRFHFLTQYRQRMQVDALVVDCDNDDFLVGEDWMYSRGVKIDFVASEMKWYDGDAKMVVPFTGIGTMQRQELQAAKVRVMKTVKVRTCTVCNVSMPVAAKDGTVGIFVPKSKCGVSCMITPTVTAVTDGKVKIPVVNPLEFGTRLPTRESLGTWTPLSDGTELHQVSGDMDRDAVKRWIREVLQARDEPLSNEDALVVGEMDPEDRNLLMCLLRNYPKLIEPRTGCPPMTTLGIEHAIHTGSEPPIKVRPRRYARAEQEVIDAEVDKMLKDNVIEEGQGAWGFPVVLVKKKDGSVRFCIDYRMLNNITKKDVYPLPRIDDTIESMHGARRFTSLDLHAGYWQVPVAEEDRDKTGFVTRRGLFRFIRMPFGLANAPGTFQRMMDKVLRGLSWQCCLVYLDDVIIYTKGNIARHVVQLSAVLERLSQAGLSLKAAKCSFGTTHLEYLGHELDEEGVRPLDRLVKSVREFPTPTDETSVKRFVHMAGSYRRFIANFGSKAAPLTKLLCKSSEWQWGEAQQSAFERLKRELIQKPLLVYPDFSKPFKLVTDASVVGLGAALMQDQGQGDQPVAYASKVNSETVAKYKITDLECAALIWAVKLFRPYLYGRRFQLVTDHSALKWLMTSKNLTGRLHRWALQLQEYDFTIEYRPGSTNVVADALSRAPVR